MRRVGAMIARRSLAHLKACVAAFEQAFWCGWTIGRMSPSTTVLASPTGQPPATVDLLRLPAEVIFAHAGAGVEAARQATRTLPIVFVGVSEPVTRGFVASLARPGGNITGFTNIEPSVAGKLVELIKQIAPRTTRVAFPFSLADDPVTVQFYRSVEMATAQLGLSLFRVHVQEPADLDTAIANLGTGPATCWFRRISSCRSTISASPRSRPATRCPRSCAALRNVRGGLIYYGPDVADEFRRAAEYVDRVLRGEKPADPPVQQPTKFNLVINSRRPGRLTSTCRPRSCCSP
jgi:putative ABC transport system substrate-binding protein